MRVPLGHLPENGREVRRSTIIVSLPSRRTFLALTAALSAGAAAWHRPYLALPILVAVSAFIAVTLGRR
jgi:hypothetical protein